MDAIEIDSWNDYPKTIEKIVGDYNEHWKKGIIRRPLLYRGQADANWDLITTLERYSPELWSFISYLNMVDYCLPQIESFTKKKWDLKGVKLPAEIEPGFQMPNPYNEFLVYLRQHGFPSPLLDWTASPYIAAFFAFEQKNTSQHASIFVYSETQRGFKSSWEGEPIISVQNPLIRTHERHFLQQSWYTLCAVNRSDSPEFTSHEAVFNKRRRYQDVLTKIIIPQSERLTALRYLHDVNINSYSLFQSVESLISSLALREIVLKRKMHGC